MRKKFTYNRWKLIYNSISFWQHLTSTLNIWFYLHCETHPQTDCHYCPHINQINPLNYSNQCNGETFHSGQKCGYNVCHDQLLRYHSGYRCDSIRFTWFVLGSRWISNVFPHEFPILNNHHYCTSPTVRYRDVMVSILDDIFNITTIR